MFDSLAIVPDISNTTLRKVLRWAVKLSIYNYVCFNVRGEDNFWDNILGRWSPHPQPVALPLPYRFLAHL